MIRRPQRSISTATLFPYTTRFRSQSETQRAAAARLDGLRHERADAERRLEETREKARRAELDAAEVKLRLESAVEALRRDLDVEPDVAMATAPPERTEGVTPTALARQLAHAPPFMGPLTPLPLEESDESPDHHELPPTHPG